ncbi:MAG: hypothetical protein KAW09_07230, partial [Thermoplasmata archaeon]|nr:hypothetical protein [Thermoplasmata archaeon]
MKRLKKDLKHPEIIRHAGGSTMRRVTYKQRRSGLAVSVCILVMISVVPFVSQNIEAQPGIWTDTFDDETKVLSKSNTEVVGGFARIQTLATDYTWRKEGIVVDRGGPSKPDERYAYYPWVLKGSDGLYRMWYSSLSASNQFQIMHATSWDGYVWEKKGVVISPGFSGTGSDSERVYSPCVIYEAGQYIMYYTAVDPGDIRITLMATSADGIAWSYAGLALNYGGPGESLASAYASVLRDGSTFKSWYSGFGTTWQMFHATSSDAFGWTKQGLVMPLGAPGEPDDTSILKNTVVRNST